MSDYIETELETPFGSVVLRCWGADHIDLDAAARNLNAPESVDYFPGIVVNRVPLSLRMQFYRREDGAFGLGKSDKTRYVDSFSVSRTDKTSYRETYSVSWAARDKIERTLEPLVNEWAVSEHGRNVLLEAREAQELAAMREAQAKVNAARDALAIAEGELDALLFPSRVSSVDEALAIQRAAE
jgi:hypothetical protein